MDYQPIERESLYWSVTITTFETLTDDGYIPCFQESAGKFNMTAYCPALDFGCKAYANLVMLHLIQKEIVEKVSMMLGQMTLILKSAHFLSGMRKRLKKVPNV